MNRVIVSLVCVLVVMCAIIAGLVIYENGPEAEVSDANGSNVQKVSEKVTDDCVDEYMEMQNSENIVDVNSSNDVKLSPNCSLIIKTYYDVCKHTTNQYLNLPEDLVNKNEEEFKEKYSDYNIDKFTENEVIISKNEKGECGEHYIVREVDGTINVFRLVNGIEELYEKTDISDEYLTETDRIEFKNGIKVYGRENLSQLLEDFE